MKRPIIRLMAALALAGAVVGVACSESGTVDKEKAKDQAQTAATQVQQSAQNAQNSPAAQDAQAAWASLRSDAYSLIDQLQTRADPGTKQQLLDRCRATQDQFKKNNDAANADRVGKVCDQVRDTQPNAQGAWNEIKSQINKLDFEMS
jgi:hypothetical protein